MLDYIALQLDREGIKGREDGERGVSRGGGHYFKFFPSKGGDYSREAITRGTAVIRGNAVPRRACNNANDYTF